MSAPTVRADYDALAQVARQFGQQTDTTRQTLQRVKECMEVLEGGDWVGTGATKFYAEMNSSVLPTLNRLVNALEGGARTTQAASQVMKAAEEEAARYLTVQGGGGKATASPGGSGTGGGQGGQGGSIGGAIGAAVGSALGATVGGALGGAVGRAIKGALDNAAVLDGTISAKSAPKTVTLPDAFEKGMQDAWKDSFPGGHEQEQGGLLVKNKDGSYGWVRGKSGTGGAWTPNLGDLGADQTYLGLGHTHPYDDGDVDVPHSAQDVSWLFEPEKGTQAEIMVVQSGDTQFLLGRTEEFKAMLAGKSRAEVTTIIGEMTKLMNDTEAAQLKAGKSFAEANQAAVKAAADKYQLVFYKGTKGNLTLQ